MIEFLTQIISPAMLPYTILLGLVLLFWIIVIIGAVDIDILDFGDFGMDGMLEEAGEAAEGAASNMSAFDAIMGFLNLGSVPVTIIASIVIFQMWIMAFLIHTFLPAPLKGLMPAIIFGILLFFLVFVISLFIAGLTSRPLRRVFRHVPTHGQEHLVGKICVVKSSKVTDRFGQAEMKVKDSDLLLSIRCKEDNSLKKGDEAVIVDYNKQKDTYDVKSI